MPKVKWAGRAEGCDFPRKERWQYAVGGRIFDMIKRCNNCEWPEVVDCGQCQEWVCNKCSIAGFCLKCVVKEKKGELSMDCYDRLGSDLMSRCVKAAIDAAAPDADESEGEDIFAELDLAAEMARETALLNEQIKKRQQQTDISSFFRKK